VIIWAAQINSMRHYTWIPKDYTSVYMQPETVHSAIQAITDKYLGANELIAQVEDHNDADPFTIESMRSKEYSVGIFFFMVLGIAVFSAILYNFFLRAKSEGMRTGEKLLFAWLVLGVVAALAFGTTQLLFGHLF